MATAEDAGRAVDMFNGFEWMTRVLEVRPDRMGTLVGGGGNGSGEESSASSSVGVGGSGSGLSGNGTPNHAHAHSHTVTLGGYN